MAERGTGTRPPNEGAHGPLEGLTPEQHRIVAYASAIGSEFEFSLLLGAMAMDEEVLAEEVERLVHRGVLVERAGGERFAFAEEEDRARIYRSLTESRLRVLHRKIGEALERSHPNPSLPVLTELGRHYFLGKVPAKSYEYNRRAAETARAAGEPEVASHHLERVLLDLASLPGEHWSEQAQLAEELGDLYYSLGNFREADLRFTQALEHLGDTSPRTQGRLLLARAEVARETLDLDTAVARGTEALRLFDDARDRVGSAQAHRLLARIAFRRGAYRDSLDECMQALDLLVASESPRPLGSLAIDLGNAFSELGPDVRDVSIAWYERAVQLLGRPGDEDEIARAYLNLGTSLGESRPQDGLECLEKATAAATVAHDSRTAARSLVASAELRLSLGQIDDAERDNEQVSRLLEHTSDELGRGWVESVRGLIAERRGLWEEAERAYETALEICRRHELPADEAEAAFRLARLRHKTRDLDGARRAYMVAADLGLPELRPMLTSQFLELGVQIGALPTSSAPPKGSPPAPARAEANDPPDERGF